MQSSTSGERLTAAVSTVVAIAILGAAVTAQQVSEPVANAVASYESDLRYQIDLALRHDGDALRKAHEAVDQTLKAWHESPQSAQDRQLLLGWFDAAISATMPGHSGKLPPQPEFTSASPIIVAAPRQPTPPPAAEPTPTAAESADVVESAETSVASPVDNTPVPTFDVVAEPAPAASELAPEEPTAVSPVVVTPAAVEPPVVESAPVEHSVTIVPAHVGHSQPTTTLVAPPETVVETAPSEPVTTTAPPVGATPYEVATEPAVVSVNLAELNARIEGCNQQLAEIESSLVVEGGATGQRLTRLVEQFEQLAQQYQFVALYVESLTAAEREHIVEPRSMRNALAQAVALAVREEEAADFLADFEAENAAPTLADRLQAVAESAGLNR